MKEMVKEAKYGLLNYPERSPGYYLKRSVKMAAGRKMEPIDKINWPNGLLAIGLVEYYKRHRNSEEAREIQDCLKKYYDRWIAGKCRMYYVDDALSGIALLELYGMTGDEKYKQAADTMARFLLCHETDAAGSLPYRPGQKNGHIYADMIGMACPFLCKYGCVSENEKAVRLAVSQINNFINFGMDARTNLPYHGYHYKSGVKYGIIGWGRAVGWLMLGMSETLEYIGETHPDYESIKQSYRRIVDKVEAYQLENGLYSWQLSAKEGPVDTSATAMILYSIARSLSNGVLIGIHRSRMTRGREALLGMVQEGRIGSCLGECQGFCMYPQVYGIYPWSLGPALALFSLTEEGES